jgi:hypothetical protein
MLQASWKALLITRDIKPGFGERWKLEPAPRGAENRLPMGIDFVGELADEPIGEDRRHAFQSEPGQRSIPTSLGNTQPAESPAA